MSSSFEQVRDSGNWLSSLITKGALVSRLENWGYRWVPGHDGPMSCKDGLFRLLSDDGRALLKSLNFLWFWHQDIVGELYPWLLEILYYVLLTWYWSMHFFKSSGPCQWITCRKHMIAESQIPVNELPADNI